MKENRSAKYQYMYFEKTFSPDTWRGLNAHRERTPDLSISHEVQALREELIQRIKAVAKEVLTEKQYVVFILYLQGKSQSEISKLTNRNQSGVNKCLHGSPSAKDPTQKHGGLFRKLKAACLVDDECSVVLEKIAQQEEKESN